MLKTQDPYWILGKSDGFTQDVRDMRDDMGLVCSNATPKDAMAIVEHADAFKRLRLIKEVILTVLAATESLDYDNLGGEMVYLLHAIADEGMVEWDTYDHETILDLFKRLFPVGHVVWQYIEIMVDGKETT